MLKNTPICQFGWEAPAFDLKDFNGKSFSFKNLMGKNGLLIIFMCNHCPYVKNVIERMIKDCNKLKALDINSVGVMSNDFEKYESDNPQNMKNFAKQNNINFPYLVDSDQKVAREYNAICTPDFFGLNSCGKLQYRGRIDNLNKNVFIKRKAELLNAMIMVSKTGKGPSKQYPSIGCSIKWKI